MKVIYKYNIDINGATTLDLPNGSIVVDFASQGHFLQIWIEQDTSNPIVKRTFTVVATGQPVPDSDIYLKTTRLDGYVWHLFEQLTHTKQ